MKSTFVIITIYDVSYELPICSHMCMSMMYHMYCSVYIYSGYWIHWTFISICWGFLLLLDFLFMNDDSFIYDPSYRGWAQRSGYE